MLEKELVRRCKRRQENQRNQEGWTEGGGGETKHIIIADIQYKLTVFRSTYIRNYVHKNFIVYL